MVARAFDIGSVFAQEPPGRIGQLLRNLNVDLTVLAYAALPVLAIAVAAEWRRGGSALQRLIRGGLDAGIVLWLAAVAAVTVSFHGGVQRVIDLEEPFYTLGQLAKHGLGSSGHFLGNLLLLTPLGVLVPWRFPVLDRWWRMAAAGFGLLFLIEFVQYWGGRSATVDDVVAGLTGLLVAYGVYRIVRAGLRLSRRPRMRE